MAIINIPLYNVEYCDKDGILSHTWLKCIKDIVKTNSVKGTVVNGVALPDVLFIFMRQMRDLIRHNYGQLAKGHRVKRNRELLVKKEEKWLFQCWGDLL